MPKIKLSKTELKRQRDGLKRYTRFLPTLQLKKQQLQMEILKVSEEINAQVAREKAFDEGLHDWVELMSSAEFEALPPMVEIESVQTDLKNIAGLDLPVFVGVTFKPSTYDLYVTPAWLDVGLDTIEQRIALVIQRQVLNRQMELLREELRTTTQRVNLFEKVKIPGAEENIRAIQIHLGDQLANGVGCAKLAKAKCNARDLAMAAEA